MNKQVVNFDEATVHELFTKLLSGRKPGHKIVYTTTYNNRNTAFGKKHLIE